MPTAQPQRRWTAASINVLTQDEMRRLFDTIDSTRDYAIFLLAYRGYDTHFMLRLDEASRTRLEALVEHFRVSKADMIRQLIAQAMPDDFPTSWQMRANEHRPPHTRQIVPR
jgi:hypothetical protein